MAEAVLAVLLSKDNLLCEILALKIRADMFAAPDQAVVWLEMALQRQRL